MGSEFGNQLFTSNDFFDCDSFESAKVKIIEQCMARLNYDNELQKMVYKGTGGLELWWSDLDKTTDLSFINETKAHNLKHINDMLSTEKHPGGMKQIDTVFRFNMDNYGQIEELQKQGLYLAKQMFKKNETYCHDIKSILYEKDITGIKFSEFNNTHQLLILISTTLNILITLISTVSTIIKMHDHLVFLLIPPSVSFLCSISTSLVNHWRLGPVTSELSALMVEQSELIRTLHKYRRMINTRMPLTFVSVEKTSLLFDELRSLSNDMERDILDSFCNVKTAYSKNISLEDRVHLIKRHNGFLFKKKLHKKINEHIVSDVRMLSDYGKNTNCVWFYIKQMFCVGTKFTYHNISRMFKPHADAAEDRGQKTNTNEQKPLYDDAGISDAQTANIGNRSISPEIVASENYTSDDRYQAMYSQMANLRCTNSHLTTHPMSIFIDDTHIDEARTDSPGSISESSQNLVIV